MSNLCEILLKYGLLVIKKIHIEFFNYLLKVDIRYLSQISNINLHINVI